MYLVNTLLLHLQLRYFPDEPYPRKKRRDTLPTMPGFPTYWCIVPQIVALVNTIGPSSVIATECSNTAADE